MLDSTVMDGLRLEYEYLLGQRELLEKKISGIKNVLEMYDVLEQDHQPAFRPGIMKAIADAAYPIILSNDRPLHRSQLLEKLEASGITLSGDDRSKKLMLLSSALSKDARFTSVGRGTGLWDIDSGHKVREEKIKNRETVERIANIAAHTRALSAESKDRNLDSMPSPDRNRTQRVGAQSNNLRVMSGDVNPHVKLSGDAYENYLKAARSHGSRVRP